MYYEKHRRSAAGKDSRRRRIIAAIALLMLLIIAADVRIKPMMRTMLREKARAQFSAAANCAVSEVLQSGGFGYDSFVRLNTSGDGDVTSIETDSAAVNAFCAQVCTAISGRMADYQSSPERIPIGSLTGIAMLTGRGPDVQIRIDVRGSVAADITGSFTQAGINQTLHTINCTVTAEAYTAIPGMSEPMTFSTDVMIAQSVIVGDTPDSFTYVYGDQSDTIGRIFDYGDPYGEDIAN